MSSLQSSAFCWILYTSAKIIILQNHHPRTFGAISLCLALHLVYSFHGVCQESGIVWIKWFTMNEHALLWVCVLLTCGNNKVWNANYNDSISANVKFFFDITGPVSIRLPWCNWRSLLQRCQLTDSLRCNSSTWISWHQEKSHELYLTLEKPSFCGIREWYSEWIKENAVSQDGISFQYNKHNNISLLHLESNSWRGDPGPHGEVNNIWIRCCDCCIRNSCAYGYTVYNVWTVHESRSPQTLCGRHSWNGGLQREPHVLRAWIILPMAFRFWPWRLAIAVALLILLLFSYLTVASIITLATISLPTSENSSLCNFHFIHWFLGWLLSLVWPDASVGSRDAENQQDS